MKNYGELTIIIGSMFASKTSTLQKIINDAKNKGNEALCFTLDTRFDDGFLTNHDGKQISAFTISSSKDILKHMNDYNNVQLVAIDEGQFFDEGIRDVCFTLNKKGIDVVVAGLDQDYKKQPFMNIINLMLDAENIIKLDAVCNCGKKAIRNFRKIKDTSRMLQGSNETYSAMCKFCFSYKIGDDYNV